ncbi:MAG: hypothetical protein H7Y07_12735 [Pyrinomonadaceae bacterium]|nr:hypothetical protein [Sphingobacteriaceae bacterium]
MKTLIFSFFLALAISANAQKVDYGMIVNYELIKSVVSKTDIEAHATVRAAGYTPMSQGEFQYIKDNKIYSRAYFIKGNPDGEPNLKNTYWAFQARGKDVYKGVFKEIKKGAIVKEGTRMGKAKTEYKAKDGLYYYPFEDISIKGLYWIYASKGSLLD